MTPAFFDRTLLEWTGYCLLSAGFVLALIIQFGFYFRLLFLKKSNGNNSVRPISLLLNIRNEEERIEQVLMQLLNQDYPDFEVIVVDDFSEDTTLTIVGVMAKKYPRLKFSSLNQETRFSEKMAINLALKAAKYDWVVFISPESERIDPHFLRKLNDQVGEEEPVVLNYVNYSNEKGFYNRLCRVDRFHSFLTSAAYSQIGMPVFFQQTNVLFRKQIYFDVAGFRGKMNAHFANMELLFNQIKKNKVKVFGDQETCLRENVSLKRADYSELVRKQILLLKDLNWLKKMILSVEWLSQLLLLIGLIWLLVTEMNNWFIYVPPVVLILIIHLFMVKTLLKRLSERKIFISSLMYVFAKPVINMFYKALIYTHVHRNKWN